MLAAIDDARTLANMDELSKAIWQAHASGVVDDDGAQTLAEALHARRGSIRGSLKPVGIPAGRLSLFPPKRLQRAPERSEAIARRRRLATSGPMPPALASRFTMGQLAVLRIIADEMSTAGVCGLCMDAIAARAGVCRRLAQAAIRLAEGDGLIVIQERRHEGRKNDANLIRVISQEWLTWIKRGRRSHPKGHRVQMSASHGYTGSQQTIHRPAEPSQKLPEGRGRHRSERPNQIRTAR
ncbi:hypothetical protein GGR33_005210 [Methylobacterium brachythecii]|uniref:Uncharacterized protein n=1 Tax=Methylobacterium brachythecii TaxID=1176177 RepID=A0A7W6AN66_9HYPH|nr:hypothetical protein [Methylobacterium brachythecii]MBB3905668.1 hypothetical protein [Methylobacterium brachythecii]GLS46932.1 hypothetical protein GCM10007884_49320 [Methylobacterium brachythecii]